MNVSLLCSSTYCAPLVISRLWRNVKCFWCDHDCVLMILLIQVEKVKAQREARAAVAKKKSSKKFRCSELNKVNLRLVLAFHKTLTLLLFCAHYVTSISGYWSLWCDIGSPGCQGPNGVPLSSAGGNGVKAQGEETAYVCTEQDRCV